MCVCVCFILNDFVWGSVKSKQDYTICFWDIRLFWSIF